MLTAVKEDADYTDTSYYAMQLRPYRALFGANNVFAMTTEGLRDRPTETMAGLFRWLGVDESFVPPNLQERANEAPEVIPQVRGRGLLHRFRTSWVWNTVGPIVPRRLRTAGRKFSEKPIERQQVDSAEVRRYLRPRQLVETAELQALLGRAFPEWTTLHGDD